MICNNCSSAGLDSAFSKSSGGSRNYRRDKILQHQSSKGHKSAIQKLKTVQHTKSDILEPVSSSSTLIGLLLLLVLHSNGMGLGMHYH